MSPILFRRLHLILKQEGNAVVVLIEERGSKGHALPRGNTALAVEVQAHELTFLIIRYFAQKL